MAFKIIKYKMPDGKIKSVETREDLVEWRLERLAWAHLEVISIEHKRET